jgi:hypothetical protein
MPSRSPSFDIVQFTLLKCVSLSCFLILSSYLRLSFTSDYLNIFCCYRNKFQQNPHHTNPQLNPILPTLCSLRFHNIGYLSNIFIFYSCLCLYIPCCLVKIFHVLVESKFSLPSSQNPEFSYFSPVNILTQLYFPKCHK